MRKSGMSAHERPIKGETDVWLTPKPIIDMLGPFDLDPCADADQPWATATTHYTIAADGLSLPWHGFVWCNPPYSSARLWLERLANHGNGIALIFARTETVAFHEFVWARCTGLLFPCGRIQFVRADGQPSTASNSGAPSVYVAYGLEAADRLQRASIVGAYVDVANLTPHETPAQQQGLFV